MSMKRGVPRRPSLVRVSFDFQSTFRYTTQQRARPKRRARRRLYLCTRTELREALDPSTDPERLRLLSRRRHLAAMIAANPNAPPSLLRALCVSHPSEVLANPSLPLVLLEDPGFLHGLTAGMVMTLLSSPGCPPEYFEACAGHPEPGVRAFLADHPQTSAALLWRLSSESLLATHIATNPSAPAALLIALAEGEHSGARELAAVHPAMPREHLRWLQQASGSLTLRTPYEAPAGMPSEVLRAFAGGGLYARWLAARHPETPLDCLESLAQHRDEQLRIYLASNPSLTPALAARLAEDPERSVRAQIGQHARLPEASMRLLARDENSDVRASVADNPRLPVFLLGGMARDEELSVRAAVLRSGRVTPAILASLAQGDPEPELLLLLCEHPRLPAAVLQGLLRDPSVKVRQAAKTREKLLRARRKK